MSRSTRSFVVFAICSLVVGLISQVASAATFSTGKFNKAEDLGWDVGNTPLNAFVQAEELGTTGPGTMTVGAITFTDSGNAGQGSYNFFNANFGGAYASQMN